MSEMLWFGSFPMTQISVNPDECQQDNPAGGWRFCPSANAGMAGNASTVWRNHDKLIEYYANASVPYPKAAGNDGDNNEVLDALNEGKLGIQIVSSTPETDESTISRTTILTYIDQGALANGGQLGKFDVGGLSTYFRTNLNPANGPQIRAGDYLWINSQISSGASADAHGLFVVGWQIAQQCPNALTHSYGASELYDSLDSATASLPENSAVVPYVVDFNRLQRPSARPFYCTAYHDDINAGSSENYFGGDHSWYFYSLPKQLLITSQQLYVPKLWQWEVFSGER
jgi:hypothetical protein